MNEKILQELDLYEKAKNQASRNILNELKKNCSTYKEVEDNLLSLKRNLLFKQNDREKYQYLLTKVHLLLEEEKSDLLITNHF